MTCFDSEDSFRLFDWILQDSSGFFRILQDSSGFLKILSDSFHYLTGFLEIFPDSLTCSDSEDSFR